MPEDKPHDLDAEECPDLAEANALGDAFARIFGGVRVCPACSGLVHRDEQRCPCGKRREPDV